MLLVMMPPRFPGRLINQSYDNVTDGEGIAQILFAWF
jgi:hypothetical protein